VTTTDSHDKQVIERQTVERVVAAYGAALNPVDGVAWAALFAPDATLEDPVGTPPRQGPDAVLEFAQGAATGFRELALHADGVFIAAHEAAIKWTGRAVAKDGRSLTFEGVDIIQVNPQGRVTSARAYWDPAPVMALHQP
jgi:steroid delta-isomerase